MKRAITVLLLVLLIAARQWIEKGTLSPAIGTWPVHLLFAALGFLLLFSEELRLRRAVTRDVDA